ncbi:hypothetical protein BG004_005429 [Podila humilis]|nr:hypothetical protein BG004_005429 [Podila humilis]
MVERIMVLPHVRMAIVHCDSTLSFYSLPDFIPYSPQDLPHIKGVTAFCDDGSQKGRAAEDGSVRLCVTKRRIIQFYSLWPGAISEAKELSLPNGALVVTRWKNYVCVADANDFKLIDSRVGRMIPVLPVVQNSNSGSSAQVIKPVCVAIAENEFLLASATSSGQTAIGIFCSGNGDPVRGTLQWSSYPRALGVEFPYVAALLRNGTIEIHNILDQRLIQTIRFDQSVDPRTLVQGPGLAVWMSALANILTMRSGDTTISTGQASFSPVQKKNDDKIVRISTVLTRVLVAGRENVSALVTTPLILHADGLLRNGRVEEALVLSEKTTTTLSADNLHSERLQHELDYIYQKSGLIYLGETLFDDAFALFQRGKMDPRVVISLFPDVLQKQDLLFEVTLFVGVLDLLRQLRSLPDIITKTMLKSGGDQGDEYKQMFLNNAKEVFQEYLQTFHREHTNPKVEPSPALVATDTALLGLFVDNNQRKQLYTLLESHNSCAKSLSEQKLRESGRHYALSLLYKSHKDYRILTGEVDDEDFTSGLQGMATLLLSIHDAALVSEYGKWIVQRDEEIGLKIFMPGDSKRAAALDTNALLDEFKNTLSQASIIVYLEYLIFQRKSDNYDHRTTLCMLYVDIIGTKLTNTSVADEYSIQVDGYQKLQEKVLLERGVSLSRKHVQSDLGITFLSFLQRNASSDDISKYRSKLVQLLQSSSKYDAEALLPKVSALPQLQSEKAAILSWKQKAAIEVMVQQVKDYLGAEIYCLNAGSFQNVKASAKGTSDSLIDKSLQESKKSLFMLLLQEYLRIPQEQGGSVLALRLLNSQSAYLELSEVIDLLPPYWTVELLQNYLVRSLRRNHHAFNEIQIIKGLRLGENLRLSKELIELYEDKGPVVITADDICPACGTSIADSVFMQTLANYALAYKKIKNAAFDGPGAQSTILLFVAADVDAICAFRILTTLFKSDCISYVVVPVASMDDIQKEAKHLSSTIRSVILLNCGVLFTLEDYMELSEDVTVYVLDNHRPVDLKNAFWNNEVIVFHETDLDKELHEQKEAIIFTEEHLEMSNDSEGSDSEGDGEDGALGESDDDDDDNYRRRRRKTGIDTEVIPGSEKRKWREARDVVIAYMSKGITFGTSVSNQCYLMAAQLDRTSLNILWLAIVGLTAQYINEQIGHKDYLDVVQVYKNESERLAPKGTAEAHAGLDDLVPQTSATEEGAIRCTDEYRFMMVRHWSLYESMYHSNYVASRLGIWREPGRKRLLALLAKMGFSLEECNQVFAHMSIDLKKILRDRIETVTPEYGLNEILYTSFTRSYGYRGLMSASDAVYAVTSLLETSPAASVALGYSVEWNSLDGHEQDSERTDSAESSQSWWHSSFFKACDALDGSQPEGDPLRHGVTLCMKIQKAIVRQAIAIIEKQVIITLSTCRAATLKDGPHLPIFWNPLTLNRLAQFLVYAIREYGSIKSGIRPIPLVLAVLKEETQSFIVSGIHGSPVIGNVTPNKFGVVFEKIAYNEKISMKYLGFDKATVEIDRDDLETFMRSIGRYMR